ncbi:MAG: DinB family protein [Candidatus Acidiferrum sp.]
MSISQMLLPEFDQETANTRKTLERVPDDKWDWKPHPKSGSLGWLAGHVATLPDWIAVTINSDKLDFAPTDGPRYEAPKTRNRKELLEVFDKLSANARTALAGASDEHLMKPWTLLMGGQTLFTMPRAAVLRGFGFNHSIHHRGQLTMYLRTLDIPLPALYGPSADEQS